MKKKLHFIKSCLILLCLIAVGHLYSQQSYTFTNASATGLNGPTQAQVNTAYLGTSLAGSVTVSAGIQSFTVPVSGPYRLEAYGAQGGGSAGTGTPGGLGAAIIGDYTLTAGSVIKIIVGQMGGTIAYGGGGGGGSFIASSTNTPILVAGGGGGSCGYLGDPRGMLVGGCGLIGTAGGTSTITGGSYGSAAPGTGGGAVATGGTNGYGGGGAVSSGGAGFYNNGGQGTYASPGYGFIQGGAGGVGSTSGVNDGGFGGGGGGQSGTGYGGGAGGYSGGGAGNFNGTLQGNGGGGGSYNTGLNQVNTTCANSGHGKVILRELCAMSLTATGSNSLAPSICSGQSLTLTTNAVSNFSWSNNNTTTNSIVVNPTSTTVYTVSGTTAAACNAARAITVIVNGVAPTLTISGPASNTVCLGASAILTAQGAVTYTWTGGVTNGTPFFPTTTTTYSVSGENGCGITNAVSTITVAPLPVTLSLSTPSVCSGSPAVITSTSVGTSYTWAPNTSLSYSAAVVPTITTVYSLAVTNGTCSGNATISLLVNPVPTIVATPVYTQVCAGDPVNFSANGALSYTWTPGNLMGSSVTYTPGAPMSIQVVGSNTFGCTRAVNLAINALITATPNLSADNSLVCKGDAVNLTATGASSFAWNTGSNLSTISVNPLANTVYTVVGTNNGICFGTSTIAISVYDPTMSITGNTAICDGQGGTLTANGAGSYIWSNGFNNPSIFVNPSSNTIYNVSGSTTSLGLTCPSSASVQVIIIPNPTVTASATRPGQICKFETNTLTASGANTYTWDNGSTGASIVVTSSLTSTLYYTVTGTANNGCTNSVTISMKVNGCVGIDELTKNKSNLIIYPNPSNGNVSISFDSKIDLRLINQLGQEIALLRLTEENNYKANVQNLANGIYYLVGKKGDTKISEKIIIQK